MFGSEIHILCVSDVNSADIKKKFTLYSNQIEEKLNERKIRVKKEIIMNKNIIKYIIQCAEKNNANLITIMTEQIKRIAFWLRFAAQEIINCSSIPVMSFSLIIF